MYNQPIAPNVFNVPDVLETEHMHLRPLTINDAVKNYDAVITSEERLRIIYDPSGDWPPSLSSARTKTRFSA